MELHTLIGGRTNADEVHAFLEIVDHMRWDEVPFENSQRLEPHRGSGPGLGRNTFLVGTFIYFNLWSYHEVSHEEAEEYRNERRPIPEDHPGGYVDPYLYYQTYTEDDPMVDNEPGPPGYITIDLKVAMNAADLSSDEVMDANTSPSGPPAASSSGVMSSVPFLSMVPSVPITANQSEVISHFLREVERPSSEDIGDLAAMQNALANFISGGRPPVGYHR